MLKFEDLTKEYQSGFKLGPLNASIPTGGALALFGANGAGKSTLFGILSGNIDRTSGNATWLGQKISPDAVDLKKKIGYLPQESDLPHWVSPRDILIWACDLHGLPKDLAEVNLQRWDAMSWSHRPLATCSHGMQKRIGLALATMHNPELLILDEAFNALDIVHTRTLEKLIRTRNESQLTTIISTHTPLIAAGLCETAWILTRGSLQVLSDWPKAPVLERAAMIERRFT